MKHANREETSKNQGAATEQNKKTNKSQQGGHNEAGDSRFQTSRGNREHSSEQGEGSNWQKEKQGNKK